MNLGAFGDLHGNVFKEFNLPSDRTGSTRLDKIVDSIRYIGSYCLEKKIKYVMFSGDLYHTRGRVDTVVYNKIRDEIKALGEQGLIVIMVPGNHDNYDNSDKPEHSLHSFKELKNIWVWDIPTVALIEDGEDKVNIVGIPFSKNVDGVKQTIQNMAKTINNGYPTILLTHLGVSGAFVGSDNYPLADAFNVEDLRPDFYKYVVLGHFHKCQSLGDYTNVFYTGSPIQHSFNDEGEQKGFYVMDTSKRWDVQFVPIPSPMFFTIKPDSDMCKPEALQSLADNGHYVRFMCNENQVKDIEKMIPSSLQYKMLTVKEYTEETRVDVKIGMSFSEIIDKYAEEYNPDAKDIGLEILREVEGTR